MKIEIWIKISIMNIMIIIWMKVIPNIMIQYEINRDYSVTTDYVIL